MNNNNRNGKEVHRGQMPENMQKKDKAKPVNRIRRKSTSVAKDSNSAEPKKIPLNINKNTGNTQKSTHKGHVIKLEDKENRIHPVESPLKENTRSYSKPFPSSDNNNAFPTESPVYKSAADNNQNSRPDKENYRFSTSTGKWLLIAAVIFFIAWAVIFFYYKIGGNSHMVLALSVICAIIGLVGRRNK